MVKMVVDAAAALARRWWNPTSTSPSDDGLYDNKTYLPNWHLVRDAKNFDFDQSRRILTWNIRTIKNATKDNSMVPEYILALLEV